MEKAYFASKDSDEGHIEAERILQKGKYASKMNSEYNLEEITETSKGLENDFNKEKALEILAGKGVPSPKCIFNSLRMRVLLKGILGKLTRKAKMDLGYSPKMSDSKMLELYNQARRMLNLL